MTNIFGSRQVILITSRNKDKNNIMTASWHTPISLNPPTYAVAIEKKSHTHSLVNSSKVFTVNFIPHSLKNLAIEVGTKSGILHNKTSNLKLKETEKIDCSYLEEAIAHLECELINQIDHEDYTLFIGKILNKETHSYDKRLHHTSGEEFTTTLD